LAGATAVAGLHGWHDDFTTLGQHPAAWRRPQRSQPSQRLVPNSDEPCSCCINVGVGGQQSVQTTFAGFAC
jgi:hypothetical protein